MSKFKSEVGFAFRLVMSIPIVIFAILSFIESDSTFTWITLIVFTVVFHILVPITTYYVFEEKTLLLRTFIFKRRISYDDITRLTQQNAWKYVGMKYGASVKGFILEYQKFNDVFISPKLREAFIEKLKQHCPQVVIKQN